MFCVMTVRNLFPKLGVTLGMGRWQIGLLLMLINATQTAIFFLAGRWPGWRENFRLVIGAQLGLVAGMVILGLTENRLLLAVPMVLAGATAGLSFTLSMTYAVADERLRGLRAGIHEALGGMGGLLGPVSSGMVAEYYGLHAAYLFCAMMVGVSLLAQAAYRIITNSRFQIAGSGASSAECR